MRGRFTTAAAAAILSAAMTLPALAGQWIRDPALPDNRDGVSNWWYKNDDGSYPSNRWEWIDGDGDGLAECYCFNAEGYLYASTVTPDGCSLVNGAGAWVENGAAVQKAAAGKTYERHEGSNPEMALECIDLINAERKKAGRKPLAVNEALMEAAAIRAGEAAESFSHTRPDGSTYYTVLDEVGIDGFNLTGENIAAGQTSPAAAVRGWMNSPPHKENILTRGFTETGIGCYISFGGRVHWEQIFYDR